MHPSSLHHAEVFHNTYLSTSRKPRKIVEIGSQDVNGSLKSVFHKKHDYVGLDFVEGKGVDLVIDDPYSLPLQSGSADVVLCSSVFEHSSMFWLLFEECMRVLKLGGLLYLNVPSNGMVHRYPVDAWRFFPDAGLALEEWSARQHLQGVLLESFVGGRFGEGPEGQWCDFVSVFVKGESHKRKYSRRMVDSLTNIREHYVIDRVHQPQVLATTFDLEYRDRLEADLKEITYDSERLKAEHDALIKAHAESNQGIRTQQQEIELLRQKISELRQEKVSEISKMETSLNASVSDLWNVKLELSDEKALRHRLDDAVNELKFAEAELNVAVAAQAEQITSLRERLATVSEQADHSAKTLEASRLAEEDLTGVVEEQAEQITSLRERLAETSSLAKNEASKALAIERLQQDLRSRFDDAQDVIANLKAKVAAHAERNISMSYELKLVRKKEKSTEKRIEDLQSERVDLLDSVNAAGEELAESKVQSDNLKRVVEQAEDRVQVCEARIRELCENVAALESTVNDRDQSLASVIFELDGIREHAKAAEAELGLSSLRLSALKKDATQSREMIKELKSSFSWRLTSPMRLTVDVLLWPFRKLNSWRAFRHVPPQGGLKEGLVIEAEIAVEQSENLEVDRKVTVIKSELDESTDVDSLEGDDLTNREPFKIPPEWEVQSIKFDETDEAKMAFETFPSIEASVKLVAHYLPQFHPFEQNDAWWGKGFTEWTNVTKAERLFESHRQPRLPEDLGFYDLRLPSVLEEQARIAKNYGLYGFSFYFYWFAGTVLMETPLRQMLNNPNFDLKFCLTWANENWTRRWDGMDDDILIAQEHSPQDSHDFITYVLDYFADPRYITIHGMPVLNIYRANVIPDLNNTVSIWREAVKNAGYPGLYLVAVKTFEMAEIEDGLFDAFVDFPPINVSPKNVAEEIDDRLAGGVYDYADALSEITVRPRSVEKCFGGVMLEWDNTARRGQSAHVFVNYSVLKYKQWLANQCHRVFQNESLDSEEKFVFINAWNEWAEGTYLEPDRDYGFASLKATRSVIENYQQKWIPYATFEPLDQPKKYAILIHLHYPEVWQTICSLLEKFDVTDFDLFVTVTSLEGLAVVRDSHFNANTMLVENRGRDVFPFIEALKLISGYKYSCVCKIHSKRSVYRSDGDELRDNLYSSLLGSQSRVDSIISTFETCPEIGIAVPESSLLAHDKNNMASNYEGVKYVCERVKLEFLDFVFPAGSMFWFRPEALIDLTEMGTEDFDFERGLSDGTIPHAVERVFVLLAGKRGFSHLSLGESHE